MKNLLVVTIALALFACSTNKKDMESTASAPQDSLEVYTVTNAKGLKMTVTNFGAKIITLTVPDRDGKMADIVLGYDSARAYITGNPYYGATIGRYGNRIAKGKFSLSGKEFQLATNNGVNALHGGPKGFHNVYWKGVQSGSSLKFTYLSKDGEEGYPGNLQVSMTYTLTDNNELQIDYEASTDQETIVNLSHHSFFNLAGEGNESILGHELTIAADQYCPVDSTLIPFEKPAAVKGTPFDFTKPHTIGERIEAKDEQIKNGKGYDHNWVLNKKGNEFSLAAKVKEPASGRVMEVWTTEPGLQFYSGNFLTGSGADVGKGGKPYKFRSALCLEAQHYPDSPNHPNFPSTILKPGETYKQKTVYKFLVE